MDVIRFNFKDKKQLDLAFSIREQVFVAEQKVKPEEEFDEFENSSLHYLLLLDDKAIGTARWRITDGGVKLERFAVLEGYRRKGVASQLMNAMLQDCPQSFRIYLHAQTRVMKFYEQFGFTKEGEQFDECDIPHYVMSKLSEDSQYISLNECVNSVTDFHESFVLPVNNRPTISIPKDLQMLRYKLMREENEEYLEAAGNGDLVEVADALGDMLYILCGTIITHGLQDKMAPVFREIQRSNMSKLDENGQPIYREDGKVMKSDLYFKPDIESIVRN